MVFFKNKNNSYLIDIFFISFFTLLSLILRTYSLDTIPLGFHGDEAQTGLEARRILANGFIGFWSPSALGQSALPFYWTALIYKLTEDSIFTTRFSFAILNVLWTPFFYLLVKNLFNRKVAIASTAFIVTSAISIAFSRRADFIAVNFFIFPALLFLVKALIDKRRLYFILAGIFLGLTHHIYAGYWYSIAPILIFIMLEMIIQKKTFIKTNFINLVFFGLFYLLMAIPIFSFAFTHQEQFFGRSKMVSIFSQQNNKANESIINVISENTIKTVSMFNLTPDPDFWTSFSNKPTYDMITGILFIAGLIISLTKIKKWEYRFIMILFFFFLFSSIATVDTPSFRRSQGSIYIGYIFAGIAINYILELFKNKKIYKFVEIFLVLVITIISIFNIREYFLVRAISSETQYVLAQRLVEGVNYLQEIPEPKHVYFFSSCCTINHETIQYSLPNLKGEDRSNEFGKYSLSRSQNRNEVFIFFDIYQNKIYEVEKLYPGGIKTIKNDSFGNTLFTAYFLKN